MSHTRPILTAVLFMIITPMVATGCSTGSTRIINQAIDTQGASTLIQSNKDNPNFVIIDIRTREEFDSGHIAGAIMFDYYLPDFKEKLSELYQVSKSDEKPCA